MSFNIEEYLNSLPDDAYIIDVANKKATYLPDMSRFHNLKKLYCDNCELTNLPPLNPNLEYLHCSYNQLTSLPQLNPNLETLHCYNNQLTSLPTLNCELQIFYCHNNQLTSLPQLNTNLKILYCGYNQLTSLPQLNPNLETLYCNNNILTSLPQLNKHLQIIYYHNNLIYDVINSNIPNVMKKRVQILYNFRHLYYSLKFKKQFRYLLWVKVREPKIQEYYSPQNLMKLLNGIDESDEEEIDNVLSNW